MYLLQSKLMLHQSHAVEAALHRPEAFAHLAETGTGKSVMILEEWQRRINDGDLNDLLVVAPAGSITNWYIDKADTQPSELRKHLDPALLAKLVIATNRVSAAARHAREKLLTTTDRPRALFINVEAFSFGGKENKAAHLCRMFLKPGRAMMVVDESTTLRNHKSNRSKVVMSIGKLAKARRILTGLVTPRSPLDLFSQFNFLDQRILGYTSFTVFRSRYAKVSYMCLAPDVIVDMRLRQAMTRKRLTLDTSAMKRDEKIRLVYQLGGFIEDTRPMIDGYQNLGELRKKIAPFSFQALKKDCLDLPPKIYEPRDVQLTGEQRQVYISVLKDATAQLSSGTFVTATTALAQIMRLHQVACGHVRDEKGDIHDIPSNRVDAVLEVLEEHAGKAVIWVTYDRELRKIAAALETEYGKGSVARFWGGNAKDRGEDEKKFLTDPACRFMVSTPASGSRGNTWTVADLVIYAANSYDLEFRFQSEDRTHRIGQTLPVTYVDLVARGTVDEKILFALRNKINLSSIITGREWEKWVV